MPHLAVIVVEGDRALRSLDGRIASGYHAITLIAEQTGLARRFAEQKPDITVEAVPRPRCTG